MRYSLLILCILLATSIFSQTGTIGSLISTRGTATVYVEPDEALLDFTVFTEGEDLVDARARNAEISRNAISFLKSSGIDAKHIQTQYLNVGIRYRNYKIKETKYYEARQSIKVCMTDLDKYEEIMIGLLAFEIQNLGSPIFRTTQLREKKDEARRKAIVAAREKAEMLALEIGQDIGSAHSISEVIMENNWWSQNQNAYANSTVESNSQGAPPESGFALGQLEVKASIDVSFQLTSD